MHDLPLRNSIFVSDALTYMFEQHLRMCIIHPLVPTQSNRRLLRKKSIFCTDYACANFLQGGWDDVIRVSRRSAAVGRRHVWWCKQRERAGPPSSHSFIDFLGRRLLFEAHTVLISASMHSFTAASFSSAPTRLEPSSAFCHQHNIN